MALLSCLGVLVQILLFVTLSAALDISYCSPDNTGSGSDLGKALCEAKSEPYINVYPSAEQLSVQWSLSGYLQEQSRFCSDSRPKLLVLGLCSWLQRQYVELQRSLSRLSG